MLRYRSNPSDMCARAVLRNKSPSKHDLDIADDIIRERHRVNHKNGNPSFVRYVQHFTSRVGFLSWFISRFRQKKHTQPRPKLHAIVRFLTHIYIRNYFQICFRNALHSLPWPISPTSDRSRPVSSTNRSHICRYRFCAGSVLSNSQLTLLRIIL